MTIDAPAVSVDSGPCPGAGAQDRVLRIGAYDIRVKIDPGPEESVPLLLCGGFGISLDLMDPLIDELDGTTVIRFDVPGVGGSGKVPHPYRLSSLAAVLEEIVDVLGFFED